MEVDILFRRGGQEVHMASGQKVDFTGAGDVAAVKKAHALWSGNGLAQQWDSAVVLTPAWRFVTAAECEAPAPA